MKPARFDYYAPGSLPDVVALLVQYGDEAKVLAGGQSLVPMMNLRLAQPSVVIDLNRVPELAYITPLDDGRIAIGAMTRHADVAASPLLHERCPLLAMAAAKIGYPAIRHRGTIGGSLAHADPVSEMPCIAVTLDAELVAHGPAGDRIIPATAFFDTYFTTTLSPDEIVREIRFSAIGADEGWGFHESARKTGDFATVAVAVRIAVERGAIARAAIGIAGVADRPVRAASAEQALVGSSLADVQRGADAAVQAATIVESASDIHASTEFRRRLVGVLARRALIDAIAMHPAARA